MCVVGKGWLRKPEEFTTTEYKVKVHHRAQLGLKLEEKGRHRILLGSLSARERKILSSINQPAIQQMVFSTP